MYIMNLPEADDLQAHVIKCRILKVENKTIVAMIKASA